MDKYEVSNAKFKEFIVASGHKTEAETFGDSFVMDKFVSEKTLSKVDKAVKDAPWWVPIKEANWRHPEGPDSNVDSRQDHPVLHVSWNDAQSYW